MALIVWVQLYPGEPAVSTAYRAGKQPTMELIVEGSGSASPEAGRDDDRAGTAPPSLPGPSACEVLDALLQEAKGRDGAGDPRSALQLIQEVLRCPQGASVMRYILAGRYACRARDYQAASQYRRQVPVELRPEIEQACLKVGIQLLDHGT
jgi:hypothetical protein